MGIVDPYYDEVYDYSKDQFCCSNCEQFVVMKDKTRNCSCKVCAKRECQFCFAHCWKGSIKRGFVDEKGNSTQSWLLKYDGNK